MQVICLMYTQNCTSIMKMICASEVACLVHSEVLLCRRLQLNFLRKMPGDAMETRGSFTSGSPNCVLRTHQDIQSFHDVLTLRSNHNHFRSNGEWDHGNTRSLQPANDVSVCDEGIWRSKHTQPATSTNMNKISHAAVNIQLSFAVFVCIICQFNVVFAIVGEFQALVNLYNKSPT